METDQKKKWKEIVLDDKKPPRRNKQIGGMNFKMPPDSYVVAFIISKYHGNFVLKGFKTEVNSYLKGITHWFGNFTYYYRDNRLIMNPQRKWNSWEFWKQSWCIAEPSKETNGKFKIYKRSQMFNKDRKEYKFKRLPTRWIPLMDKL